MRVLWHSCAPWVGSGYGTQTRLWSRWLRDQGYQVAISSYYNSRESMGLDAGVISWDGIEVYPPPADGPVHGRLPDHAAEYRPDVIVILADTWAMDFDQLPLSEWPVLAWVPVDCDPLSLADTYVFRQHPEVFPVAMSVHGLRVLAKAGLKPGYVPHAIDTTVWQPDPHRDQLQAAYGIAPGQFAIGMNFNNIDPVRKATPEQWSAFAAFHRHNPDSVLFAHTTAVMDRSLDLRVLARTLGITEAVRFADQDRVHTGAFTESEMIRWYCAMDLVMNATYGEGFGLPALEAQACGTPVLLANNTTGTQLQGPGWLARTEPFWNATHQSWWRRPSIDSIRDKLGQARAGIARSPFKRDACEQFAAQYDIEEVGPLWLELIDQVAAGITPAALS